MPIHLSPGWKLALVAMGTFVAILVGEGLFRLVPFERFKYEARYGHFSGNVISHLLEYDPVLTFRNRRGASFPEARMAINTLGLRGPEVALEKRPGTRRVLCLGDSCTFGGGHPYAEFLQGILDRRFGGGRFEVLNGGVIGYTSLHGLEWYQRELARLRPDIVTIYFGWNDMWRTKDTAIRDWFARRLEKREPIFHSYFWEALTRTASFLKNRFEPGDVPLHIPPDRYRQVLEQFAELGKRDDFTPVYVTAPSGFDDDKTPAWLVDKGFVARGDSAPALRRRYNQVVLDVAREHRLPVADCAAAFEQSGGRSLFERPDEDTIHPNDRGYERIAETLAETIATGHAAIGGPAVD